MTSAVEIGPVTWWLINLKMKLRPVLSLLARQSDLFLAFLLTALAAYLGTNLFNPVRFDKEKIEVWAVAGQIQVRGLYHYQNRTLLPLSFSLGLPFPTDSNHPAPSSFSVVETNANGETLTPISLRSYHGRLVFRLLFWPKQEKWIRVDYLQPTLADSGTYILRTTRDWNRALEQGAYTLHLASGLALASSSYPLEHDSLGGKNTYSFYRAHFFPDADWSFSWHSTAHVATLLGEPHENF